MSKGLIDKNILIDIADAIREKTDSTDLIKPSQMASAVRGITGGGGGGSIKPIFDFSGLQATTTNVSSNTTMTTQLTLNKGEYLMYYNISAGRISGDAFVPGNIVYDVTSGSISNICDNINDFKINSCSSYFSLKKVTVNSDNSTVSVSVTTLGGNGRAYLMCAPFPNNARVNSNISFTTNLDMPGSSTYVIAPCMSTTLPKGHYLAIGTAALGNGQGSSSTGYGNDFDISPLDNGSLFTVTLGELKVHSISSKTSSTRGSGYWVSSSSDQKNHIASISSVVEISCDEDTQLKFQSLYKASIGRVTYQTRGSYVVIPLDDTVGYSSDNILPYYFPRMKLYRKDTNATATVTADLAYGTNGWVTFGTIDAIDLTDIDMIECDIKKDSLDDYSTVIGIYPNLNSIGSNANPNRSEATRSIQITRELQSTLQLNVQDIVGSYYIGIYGTGAPRYIHGLRLIRKSESYDQNKLVPSEINHFVDNTTLSGQYSKVYKDGIYRNTTATTNITNSCTSATKIDLTDIQCIVVKYTVEKFWTTSRGYSKLTMGISTDFVRANAPTNLLQVASYGSNGSTAIGDWFVVFNTREVTGKYYINIMMGALDAHISEIIMIPNDYESLVYDSNSLIPYDYPKFISGYVSYDNCQIKIQPNQIEKTYTSTSNVTTNSITYQPVDLTNTHYIEMVVTISKVSDSKQGICLGISKIFSDLFDIQNPQTSGKLLEYTTSPSVVGQHTVRLDVSSYSGDFYIALIAGANDHVIDSLKLIP